MKIPTFVQQMKLHCFWSILLLFDVFQILVKEINIAPLRHFPFTGLHKLVFFSTPEKSILDSVSLFFFQSLGVVSKDFCDLLHYPLSIVDTLRSTS